MQFPHPMTAHRNRITRGGAAREPGHHELNLLGVLFNQARYVEMEALAQAITEHFPGHVAGWKALGTALLQQGRSAEALVPLQKAIKLAQGDAQLHNNLGNTYVKLGRLPEAEASYRRALELKPDLAKAHCGLGIALNDQGRFSEAEASYRRALKLDPGFAGAHNNLGNTLRELYRPSEAEASFRQALALIPNFAEALRNLGLALNDQKRYSEAEASCRRALALRADYAEAYSCLGDALRGLGQLDVAEAIYRRALEIKPDYPDAIINLGTTLQALGRMNDAEASFSRALQIKPDFAEAQWNLSLVLLALGQFERGWRGYEMRWKRREAKCLPETPYPCWLGEADIAGKKLLIQSEQGLGDAIQMLRYILLLEQKDVECWVQVPHALHRLMTRSFPCSRVIEGPACPDGLDYRIPVMSLPLAMQTFSEPSIPGQVPYLTPDADRASYWREQLAATRAKTVGLVWRGNPEHDNNHNRSASLTDLLPLIAAQESIQFVALQKGLTDAERIALNDYSNTRILDGELTNFDETAAVMSNLDIVISVDTAPAHLSGALGKPTLILLPFSGEWRWMVERADSPWYPTARLFRQKSIGNWAEVVSNINAVLAEWAFTPGI